jgi:trehalose-phosphatase
MLNPLPHASLAPTSVLSAIFPSSSPPGDVPPPYKNLLLALDVDGTLAPIVANPMDAAVPSSVLRTLAQLTTLPNVHVLIISGRSRATLSVMFGPLLHHVSVASSHGFVLSSKFGKKVVAEELLPSLNIAHAALRAWHAGAPAGVTLEDNASCISVHFRNLHSPNAERRKQVEAAVDEVVAASEGALEKRSGKEVWELRPRAQWDKGKALGWLVGKMAAASPAGAPPFVLAAGDGASASSPLAPAPAHRKQAQCALTRAGGPCAHFRSPHHHVQTLPTRTPSLFYASRGAPFVRCWWRPRSTRSRGARAARACWAVSAPPPPRTTCAARRSWLPC